MLCCNVSQSGEGARARGVIQLSTHTRVCVPVVPICLSILPRCASSRPCAGPPSASPRPGRPQRLVVAILFMEWNELKQMYVGVSVETHGIRVEKPAAHLPTGSSQAHSSRTSEYVRTLRLPQMQQPTPVPSSRDDGPELRQEHQPHHEALAQQRPHPRREGRQPDRRRGVRWGIVGLVLLCVSCCCCCPCCCRDGRVILRLSGVQPNKGGRRSHHARAWRTWKRTPAVADVMMSL